MHKTFDTGALMHGGTHFDMDERPLVHRVRSNFSVTSCPNKHQTSIHTEIAAQIFSKGLIR